MTQTTEQLTYSVPGVSCEHCRTAITGEVGVVAGVESVEVDLDGKIVTVRGEALQELILVRRIPVGRRLGRRCHGTILAYPRTVFDIRRRTR